MYINKVCSVLPGDYVYSIATFEESKNYSTVGTYRYHFFFWPLQRPSLINACMLGLLLVVTRMKNVYFCQGM